MRDSDATEPYPAFVGRAGTAIRTTLSLLAVAALVVIGIAVGAFEPAAISGMVVALLAALAWQNPWCRRTGNRLLEFWRRYGDGFAKGFTATPPVPPIIDTEHPER